MLLPVVIANFALSRYFERTTDHVNYVLSYLYNVIAVSEKITRLKLNRKIPAREQLIEQKQSIRRIRKALKLVSMSQNHESILINNLMYLINLTFPYDLIAYSFSMNMIVREIEIMKVCYLSIGSLDASIATASYIKRNPQLCTPLFGQGHEIKVQDIYHPLLKNHVCNSFISRGQSALITGSNMAGKTTFIKTMGVNLILARTLWLCHATEAQFPLIDIFSSIKTEDGLEAGKSFYFSELERLKLFLEITESGRESLLLIDEIYRGTNTLERIAGAAAVLQELATRSLVLVTTHDVELAAYLGNQFDLWFFEETGNTSRPFDYKLRAGVCKTRNAIKLMDNIGYPERITKRAKAIVQELSTIQNQNV